MYICNIHIKSWINGYPLHQRRSQRSRCQAQAKKPSLDWSKLPPKPILGGKTWWRGSAGCRSAVQHGWDGQLPPATVALRNFVGNLAIKDIRNLGSGYIWDDLCISMGIAMTTVMICSSKRLFVPQMQDHPIEEVMEYIDWTPFFQAPWLPPMSKWWRWLCCFLDVFGCFWMFVGLIIPWRIMKT